MPVTGNGDIVVFAAAMDVMVAETFPKQARAYREGSAELYADLDAGKADDYLRLEGRKGEDVSVSEFGVDIATAISIVTLMKLVAEAYLAWRKALDSKAPESGSAPPEKELKERLAKYVEPETAARIVEQFLKLLNRAVEAK